MNQRAPRCARVPRAASAASAVSTRVAPAPSTAARSAAVQPRRAARTSKTIADVRSSPGCGAGSRTATAVAARAPFDSARPLAGAPASGSRSRPRSGRRAGSLGHGRRRNAPRSLPDSPARCRRRSPSPSAPPRGPRCGAPPRPSSRASPRSAATRRARGRGRVGVHHLAGDPAEGARRGAADGGVRVLEPAGECALGARGGTAGERRRGGAATPRSGSASAVASASSAPAPRRTRGAAPRGAHDGARIAERGGEPLLGGAGCDGRERLQRRDADHRPLVLEHARRGRRRTAP